MQPEGRTAHTPRRIGIHTHWRSDRTLLSETTKRCGQPSRAPSQFENRLRSVNSPVPLVHCFTAHNPGTYVEALKQPLQLNTMPYCGFICIPPQRSMRVHPLHSSSSGYPEGNFGGNQLLGGSMSLSPLCPDQTTRFARQDGGQPPPRFPKALLYPGIAHHLSGPTAHAGTQNPVR